MPVINGVEAHQRREETPVGFRQAIADEEALVVEALIDLVERVEEGFVVLFVNRLFGRKARFVDAVVDGLVDLSIDLVDRRPLVFRIKIEIGARPDTVEGRIEHADDLRRFVGDDGLLFLVPQDRNGDATAVIRFRLQIDLVKAPEAVEVVGMLVVEDPAFGEHERTDDRHADHVRQPLEAAEDQRAVRPRTGERHIEMIAAGFGLEATFA